MRLNDGLARCIFIGSFNYRSLMINSDPVIVPCAPQSRAPCYARSLAQGVGKQIVAGGDHLAVKIFCAPLIRVPLGVSSHHGIDYEVSAVPSARGTGFPEVVSSH